MVDSGGEGRWAERETGMEARSDSVGMRGGIVMNFDGERFFFWSGWLMEEL